MQKQIFIAGCGRSGTRPLLRLMSCFADTYVYLQEEVPVSFFDQLDRPERNVVIKRTARCYRTLEELSPDIDLIYCIRHPFDTMTSKLRPEDEHFHITSSRWKSEFRALCRLERVQPNRQISFVRYENLVTNPDEVQTSLSTSMGLEACHLFSDNPHTATIRKTSVRKWGKSPILLDNLSPILSELRDDLNSFCSRFEYDLPETA